MKKHLKHSQHDDSAEWGSLLFGTWIVSLMAGVVQIVVHRSAEQDWATSDRALIVWFACLSAVTLWRVLSLSNHRADISKP